MGAGKRRMSNHDQPDEQLLEDFASGNNAALGDLAHRYEALMLGLACGLLGQDRSLACDAVQDAWVRVIKHAASFRRESTVKTWIYRITINCCKDLLSKSRRNEPSLESTPDPDQGDSLNDCPETENRRRRLNHALMTLPLETRALLLLCYQHDMTHTTAAVALRLPVGTLKSRLHAALGELRQLLESEVRP